MPGNEPGNAPLLKERLMTIRFGVYMQSKTCVTLHMRINTSYLLRINTVLLCTYKLQSYLLSLYALPHYGGNDLSIIRYL